jgi:hypothetical protein
VSFFVMLIVSDALHFRLFQFDRVPAPALRLPLPRPAQAQAPAAALVPVAVKSSARP